MDFHTIFKDSLPKDTELPVYEWAEKNFIPIGGEYSNYLIDNTPFFKEPLEIQRNATVRKTVILAPIQTGKSAVGEIAASYWKTLGVSGNLCFFFETDGKAQARWKERIEPQFRACSPLSAIIPFDAKGEANICQILTPSGNILAKGVESDKNLTSATYRYLVLDEAHAYEQGKLSAAMGRAAGIRLHKIIIISTGSNEGDDLHSEWESSTKQEWQWVCPICKKSHTPEFRKEEGKLGGLIYDLKSHLQSGVIDKPKLRESIRYEFPCCGHQIKDDAGLRKSLNAAGHYSEPVQGSDLSVRGYRVSGPIPVATDWCNIVLEKNKAFVDMKNGEFTPFKRYLNERECLFFNPKKSKPDAKKNFKVIKGLTKGTIGLSDKLFRGMTIDCQRGSGGDSRHFYAVIKDWAKGKCLTIFEGRVETAQELRQIQLEYHVEDSYVLIDSGWNSSGIYKLCHDYGWSALKGSEKQLFTFEHEGREYQKMYSFPVENVCDDDVHGELAFSFMHYSTHNIKERLAFLRSGAGDFQFIMPVDISEDWLAHMENQKPVSKFGGTGHTWKKVSEKQPDDLFMCEAYQCILWDFYYSFISSDGLEPMAELPS